MFPNLNAELSRNGISTKQFAKILGVSPKTANNKLAGRTEFTLSEIQTISRTFPEVTIGYLFQTKQEMPFRQGETNGN